MKDKPSTTEQATPAVPNAERSARIFGCTTEQAKRLMALNAQGFRSMATKARKSHKKVNGYSVAELELSANQYAEAAK